MLLNTRFSSIFCLLSYTAMESGLYEQKPPLNHVLVSGFVVEEVQGHPV
jgi:hypothetical protein